MWKQLFVFKNTQRAWHLPVVAGLCVGIPLLLSLRFNDMEAGKLASLGALVILYIQSNNLANRMIILTVCGFGLLFSYTLGAICSHLFWFSPLILAVYTFAIHYALFRLNLNRPPGNFFFTMIASMAIAQPQNIAHIAENIGNVAFGVMTACLIGLIYSLITLKKPEQEERRTVVFHSNKYSNITESIIFGTTVGASLLVAKLFQMPNPYWIPISCMAVMQGISTTHVWARAIQRVLGTFVGLTLVWGILQFNLSLLGVCVCILVLQIIIEFLIVRNYALAVIFISMLTIFLAEPNISLLENPGILIEARLTDTLIGSTIGALGGWMLYHQRIHFFTKKQMKKSQILLRKIGSKKF
ncbi:MAG TPA: FUSC family protein [Flavobacterium sp.]|nr:FUSC family protein [Flavobacterium sp.]